MAAAPVALEHRPRANIAEETGSDADAEGEEDSEIAIHESATPPVQDETSEPSATGESLPENAQDEDGGEGSVEEDENDEDEEEQDEDELSAEHEKPKLRRPVAREEHANEAHEQDSNNFEDGLSDDGSTTEFKWDDASEVNETAAQTPKACT